MRRARRLWPAITSWENLVNATHRAALGKRSRPDVAAFLCNQEFELAAIRRELLDGTYLPGPYRHFEIREPKPRRISAAPFRDRVVHHAATQILEPIIEPRFVPVSFACRQGLGTHAAIEHVQRAVKPGSYALCCDIRKYFANIDHAILMGQLERFVDCGPTLALLRAVLDGFHEREPVISYFPGDTLFTPLSLCRGLPLGNQTSQFFANVYLNGLDHCIVRQLRPRAYARYVDDLVLVDDSKILLAEARVAIEEQLTSLRLRLHPGKSRVYRADDGVSFLGWRLFPGYRRLARKNVIRFRRRLRVLADEGDWEATRQSVAAWIGHAMHGATWRLREQIFEAVPVRIERLAESPKNNFFGGFAACKREERKE